MLSWQLIQLRNEQDMDNDQISVFTTLEIVHALSEGTRAVRKSINKELSRESRTSDISIFEYLELKLDNRELTYQKSTKLLKLLYREFEYFNSLIENLIGFYSAGMPLELQRRKVDIWRLLEEVVVLFEALASEKGLRIDLFVDGDPILNVDKQLIRRALINVMDNAIKYSYNSVREERFIKIDCHRHSANQDWMISFESYGVGIKEEEITSGSIFEYGTRGELSGDRKRTGTGIGLAETKRIIDAHNGRIQIISIPQNKHGYLTTIKLIVPFGGGVIY